MTRSRISLAMLVGAIVLVAPFAAATEQTPKTFQQCGALLPAGKVYNFRMSGTIDMTSGTPALHGQLTVDDGTQVDRTKEQASQAFMKCVAPLVR